MSLEIHKNDQLSNMFDNLIKTDPKDPDRDRFLKRNDKKETKKKS